MRRWTRTRTDSGRGAVATRRLLRYWLGYHSADDPDCRQHDLRPTLRRAEARERGIAPGAGIAPQGRATSRRSLDGPEPVQSSAGDSVEKSSQPVDSRRMGASGNRHCWLANGSSLSGDRRSRTLQGYPLGLRFSLDTRPRASQKTPLPADGGASKNPTTRGRTKATARCDRGASLSAQQDGFPTAPSPVR
jgi:hypothetical protein